MNLGGIYFFLTRFSHLISPWGFLANFFPPFLTTFLQCLSNKIIFLGFPDNKTFMWGHSLFWGYCRSVTFQLTPVKRLIFALENIIRCGSWRNDIFGRCQNSIGWVKKESNIVNVKTSHIIFTPSNPNYPPLLYTVRALFWTLVSWPWYLSNNK